MSYLVRTGLAVMHRHSRGRTYRQVDTEARTRAQTHTRPVLMVTHLGGSQELGTHAYFMAEPYWTW